MKEEKSGHYYGKYRGVVTNNVDPQNLGRIQAMVPDVKGLIPCNYALPCLPAAGKLSGTFVLPEIGASVWIEFEQGDSDYPIWSGCFWGNITMLPTEAKISSPATPSIVFQTTGQNTLAITGTPATGINISAGPPGSPSIRITAAGIIIDGGTGGVVIKGNVVAVSGNTVSINETALVVLK